MAIPHKEDHRKNAEESVKKALARGDLESAANAAVKFQETWCSRKEPSVESMFPSFYPKEELLVRLKILKSAEETPPACLDHLPRDAWQKLYEAFTGAYIWDGDVTRSENILSLDLGSGIKPKWAAQMLLAWVHGKRTLFGLQNLVDSGVKLKVRIITGGEGEKNPKYQCPQSDCHIGILYDLDKVPEKPLKGCTRQPCCACWYVSEFPK